MTTQTKSHRLQLFQIGIRQIGCDQLECQAVSSQ